MWCGYCWCYYGYFSTNPTICLLCINPLWPANWNNFQYSPNFFFYSLYVPNGWRLNNFPFFFCSFKTNIFIYARIKTSNPLRIVKIYHVIRINRSNTKHLKLLPFVSRHFFLFWLIIRAELWAKFQPSGQIQPETQHYQFNPYSCSCVATVQRCIEWLYLV